MSEAISGHTVMKTGLDDVAVVAIGRNEGERLRRCLASVRERCEAVVYVDSGSTDGSLDMARSQGVHGIALDMTQPFTAARARNAGLEFVASHMPSIRFIQFVDGDCEVEAGWLEEARAFLGSSAQCAAVFGRRRERFPDKTIYNRLCDAEWNVPAGPAKYCGGDVMFRAEAILGTGGYRADLIAGEEPELCIRLRQKGWTIQCLNSPMTIHDANMTRFRQWWKRTVRTGYAYAQGVTIHGRPPERHRVTESRRAWLWGAGIPAFTAGLGLLAGPVVLLIPLIYPLQIARLGLQRRNTGFPLLTSTFLVLGKFPEAVGQIYFLLDNLRASGTRKIIEYK